jgi:hypothetical protein
LGGNTFDQGLAIAVNSSGDAYVTGSTDSANFPVTAGAFQMVLGGASNTFVTKFAIPGSSATSTMRTTPTATPTPSGTGIAVVPSVVQFPNTPVGSTSQATIKVANLGGVFGQYKIITRPPFGIGFQPGIVIPHSRDLITLSFSPQAKGDFHQQLVTITDPATGAAVFTTLEGRGIQ